MDAKFIFALFFIELGSLVFKSIHTAASELHVYNAYNQIPIVYQVASSAYSCFSTVHYCVYENTELRFLKILDLFFILSIVICYGCLFIIIVRQRENARIRTNSRITWYAVFQLIVLFGLALHTLIVIILFERDTVNTDRCNKQNRLVRVENLFNHFALSTLEVAYISFDLVNRQTLSIRAPPKQIQTAPQPVATVRLPTSGVEYRPVKTRS